MRATSLMLKIREDQKITQQDMADMLTMAIGKTISKSLYQKWERGALTVPAQTAMRVAKALEVPFAELWEVAN